MIIGNSAVFAVEWEYVDRIDDWLYGNFGLWARGVFIGNDEDAHGGVVLKGCFNWSRDIDYRGRFEPELDKMTAAEVYECLTYGVMDSAGGNYGDERFPNTYGRFYISHIGMSSFDQTILLLMRTFDGSDRLVWQSRDEEVRECRLPPGTVKETLRLALITWDEFLIDLGKS